MVQSTLRVSLAKAPRLRCDFRWCSMRLLAAISTLAAMLALSSCILGGSSKTPKTPVVPAALDPNAAAKPAPPPPPLSAPQADIQLPPAQALTPEALAT